MLSIRTLGHLKEEPGERESSASNKLEKELREISDVPYFGENYKNSYFGEVCLNGESRQQQWPPPAKFCCLSDDVPMIDVLELLGWKNTCWKLRQPSVIISVTGSAKGLDLDRRLEHDLSQGLSEAVDHTGGWIVTGGTNTGVMQIVGKALHRRNEQHFDSIDFVPVIGVAMLQRTTHHEKFRSDAIRHELDKLKEKGAEQIDPYVCQVGYPKNSKDPDGFAGLDSGHTHFLLVDNGSDEGAEVSWNCEVKLRAQLEKKICDVYGASGIQIVVQGSIGTLKTVDESLEYRMMVVLVADSGGAARLIAELIKPLLGDAMPGMSDTEREKHVAEKLADKDSKRWVEAILKTRNELSEKDFGDITDMLKRICRRLECLVLFSFRTGMATMADQEPKECSFKDVVIKTLVQAHKLRAKREKEMDAREWPIAKMKPPVDLHAKARGGHPLYPKRFPVPDHKVDWMKPHAKARSRNKAYPERFPVPDEKLAFDQEWREYKPKFFEHEVLTKFARGLKEEPSPHKWADPNTLLISEFQAELQKRKTFSTSLPFGAKIEQTLGEAVRFDSKTGAPLNPRGRTGIVGRGLLGKFGPNHAADPIVTRFHPKDPEKLQFVAIQRKDTGDWALPGGMVDAGENTSLTLRREFEEEAGKTGQSALLDELFGSGKPVYYGYVDDPRNTDNAWMETTAYHFHCTTECAKMLKLEAGDDAAKVKWLDVDPENEDYKNLYASHKDWVDYVGRRLSADSKGPAGSKGSAGSKGPAGLKGQGSKLRTISLLDLTKVGSIVDPEWPEYKPTFFEHKVLKDERNVRGLKEPPSPRKWADPDELSDMDFQTELKGRKTYINSPPFGELMEQTLGEAVRFDSKTGAPLNPRGRTGIVGRGLLGKFGPNHAADPIVTRFHPKQPSRIQFVAIQRKDTGDWALPGGMVDAGENTSQTVRREFEEEAGTPEQKKILDDLFSSGRPVYYGYVDDPRNTDNAWMETTAFHFHCTEECAKMLKLEGGDDAASAMWLDVDPIHDARYANLYASHRQLVDRVARMMKGHITHLKPPNEDGLSRAVVPDWLEPKPKNKHGQEVCVSPWAKSYMKYLPEEWTAKEVRLTDQGWADPDLKEMSKSGDLRKLHSRLTYEGPISFDPKSGAPLNPRGRTGLRGRGELGKYGPNHAADLLMTREHPVTHKLQVVLVQRADVSSSSSSPAGGRNDGRRKSNWKIAGATMMGVSAFSRPSTAGPTVDEDSEVPPGSEPSSQKAAVEGIMSPTMSSWAFPGRFISEEDVERLAQAQSRQRLLTREASGSGGIQESLTRVLLNIFKDEVFCHEDETEAAQAKLVLDQLNRMSAQSMSVVYAGYADDPRATDNAWIETVAVHMHVPYELGAELKLSIGEEGGKASKNKRAVWLDLDYLKQCCEKGPLYSNHGDWIERVERRMQTRGSSLARFTVQCGTEEMAKEIFNDASLEEHKSLIFLQDAFQQAVEMALQKTRAFDVKLIDYFKQYGCQPSAVSLAKLFQNKAIDDPYLIIEKMTMVNKRIKEDRKEDRDSADLPKFCTTIEGMDPPKVDVLSYPVGLYTGSPWHEHHVEVLERYIGNFREYAMRTRVVHYFDLMVCAIVCGANDFAYELWKSCSAPLRAAFIAIDLLHEIQKECGQEPKTEKLIERFRDAAKGVLSSVPTEKREIVLLNVPKFVSDPSKWFGVELLGFKKWKHFDDNSHSYSLSILEMAITLDNKEFIASPGCQKVVENLWCGQSAKCGKVMLRTRPDLRPLMLQLLMIIVLMPLQMCLSAFYNIYVTCRHCRLPKHDWAPSLVPCLLDIKLNDQYEWPDETRACTSTQALLDLFRVPLVKRAVSVLSYFVFTLLFCVVALQPLCGPLNAWHVVFAFWLVNLAFFQLFHAFKRQRKHWRKRHLLFGCEIIFTVLLCGAAGLRIYLSDLFGPPPQQALSMRAWVESLAVPGTPFPAVPQTGSETTASCGWSVAMELLRFLLALSGLFLFARMSEVFNLFKDTRSSVLVMCAREMFWSMFLEWLPPMLLVTFSFGISFNLLAPPSPLPPPPPSPSSDERTSWSPTQHWLGTGSRLNLAVDGPLLAPFWGMFDLWYSPQELQDMEHSMVTLPLFVWFYFMISLVLFVNLLIAMFNAQYSEVQKGADVNVQMNSCRDMRAYIAAYPVPPPLNLAAFAIDKLGQCLYWPFQAALERRGADEAAQRGADEAAQRDSSERQRDLAWERREDRHYPKDKHMHDNEIEALLTKARNKYLARPKYDSSTHATHDGEGTQRTPEQNAVKHLESEPTRSRTRSAAGAGEDGRGRQASSKRGSRTTSFLSVDPLKRDSVPKLSDVHAGAERPTLASSSSFQTSNTRVSDNV